MLIFGKKMNFRPLVVSILYFVIFSLVLYGIMGSWSLLVGLFMFLIIGGLYYPNVVNIEFNYCEITPQQIRFYDLSSWWKKVLLILGSRKKR